MIQVAKIKKTGQVVSVVGPGDTGYTLCVVQHDKKTRSGNMGSVFSVKNENLQIEKHEVAIIE